MIKRDKEWWERKALLEADSEVGAGARSVLEDLEEDSEDFTEAEVKSAVICQNEDQMIAQVRSQACPECQGPMETTLTHHRAKAGKHYCKMTLGCLARHVPVPFVVRMDWLF